MRKQTAYLVIALLIGAQLYSFVEIHSLQEQISRSDQTIESMDTRFEQQIGSIYANVDQKLEEQTSLLHRASATVGNLDPKTNLVWITFTIEPKAVTETMLVSLAFDGELVRLEKSGMLYSGRKELALSDHVSPTVILEDKGVKQIEAPAELEVSGLVEQIFPHVFARFSGETSYGKDYREKGQLVIDLKPSPAGDTFVSMKYVRKLDDEIIKEIPIALEGDGSTDISLAIDEVYPMKDEQTLTGNLVAVDRVGLTHEYLISHYVAGSRPQREPYFQQLSITAPNGEIVYQFDESTGREAALSSEQSK